MVAAELKRQLREEPGEEVRLSCAWLGLSDTKCVDLHTQRTHPAHRFSSGLPDSFFEPIDTIDRVLDCMHAPVALPGCLLVVRVEKAAHRLMLQLDTDMADNRNVFRTIQQQPQSCCVMGQLVLVDLGTPRLNDTAPQLPVASLSKSVQILHRWIQRASPASMSHALVQQEHILTRLLADSFGGCSRTVLVMDVDVSAHSHELDLAQAFIAQIKSIHNTNLFLKMDERVPILWQMERRYNTLKKLHDTAIDDLTALRAGHDLAIAQVDQLTQDLAHVTSQLADTTRSFDKHRSLSEVNSTEMQQQLTALEHDLKQLTEQYDAMKQARDEVIKKSKQDAVSLQQQHETTLAQLHAQLHDLTTQNTQLTDRLTQATQQLETQTAELIQSRAHHLASTKTIEALQKTCDKLAQVQSSLVLAAGGGDGAKRAQVEQMEQVEPKRNMDVDLEAVQQPPPEKAEQVEEGKHKLVRHKKDKDASAAVKPEPLSIVERDESAAATTMAVGPKSKKKRAAKKSPVPSPEKMEQLEADGDDQEDEEEPVMEENTETAVHRGGRSGGGGSDKKQPTQRAKKRGTSEKQCTKAKSKTTAKTKAATKDHKEKENDDPIPAGDAEVEEPGSEKKKRKTLFVPDGPSLPPPPASSKSAPATASTAMSSSTHAAGSTSTGVSGMKSTRPKSVVNPHALEMIKNHYTVPKLMRNK